MKEAHLSALLELLPDYLFVLSRDGRFLSVHSAPDGVLYIPEEAAVGRKLGDILPGSLAEKTLAALERACGGGSLEVLTYELGLRDGTHYFEGRMVAITPDSAILVSRDVTDRVKAEADLQASHDLLAEVLDRISDGFVALDKEWRYTYLNHQAATLLHRNSPEELIGKHIWTEFHEAAGQSFHQACLRAFETQQPVSLENSFEPWHLWFENRIYPSPDGLSIFFNDVTERKRSEEERRQLELQVLHAQKMEGLGLLAGGVAHDMNNVLGAILGLASTCRQGQPEGGVLARSMDTIAKACERGRTLVRGLLDFARKDLSEERILDINGVLRETLQLLERTTLQRIQLVMDLEPELHPILGDPAALSHAFMNLCINAVESMPEGGTLTFRSRNAGPDLVRITLEDTGSGMSEDTLRKALDPFFTTKPQGKGTGLGLSIAYGTVKAHRGEMKICSRTGEGTQVTLSFPVCKVRPDEASRGEAAPLSARRDLLIQVVDDDELVRCSMEVLLDEMEMRAVLASSGEQALAQLEEGLRPDLVMLDINMPGMGGAGFLPLLRKMHPEVPVFLITGRMDQAALDLAKSWKGVEVFPKPFSFDEFRARLELIAARGSSPD